MNDWPTNPASPSDAELANIWQSTKAEIPNAGRSHN